MEFIVACKKHGDKTVIVDDEDWNKIKNYKWTIWFHPQRKLYYAIAQRDGHTIYLHRILIKNKVNKNVSHLNGNTLDCRKENLSLGHRRVSGKLTASQPCIYCGKPTLCRCGSCHSIECMDKAHKNYMETLKNYEESRV